MKLHAPAFGTLLERVPRGALQARGNAGHRATVEEAAHVASGVHRPDKAPSRAERGRAQQERLSREAAALRAWAACKGLILPSGEFDRTWHAQQEIQGAEHDVYLADDGRTVWKRNNLSYHHSWQEYFERLILHNWLFPEAPMAFRGFDVATDGEFRPITTQPVIWIERRAGREAVEPLMTQFGFVCTDEKGLNYCHLDTGIIVEDLHDENVVFDTAGNLIIFDPVIYPVIPDSQHSKFKRLGFLSET